MLEPGTILQTLCEGVEVSAELIAEINRLGIDGSLRESERLSEELVRFLSPSAEMSHARTLIRVACENAKRSAKGAKPHAIPDSLKDAIRGRDGGPGTELAKLLRWFSKPRKGCRCRERALIMDRWGPRECRRQIEVIVAWLKEEALHRFKGKSSLIPTIAYKTAIWKACDLAEGRENHEDISILTNEAAPGMDDESLLKLHPFVWTYYGSGAVGDELKYSIRSVLYHWPNAQVYVVGDKPDWYTGEMIEKPRIAKTDHHAFKDCYSKVLHMASILPQFTWMMDDVYFIGRLPMSDVIAPKYVRHVSQERFKKWTPKNKWGRTRQSAYRWLLDRNRPTYDFAAHLPQPIQSASFKEMEAEAGIMREYKNWECIYLNSYHSASAQDWGRRFLRVTSKRDEILTDKPVLNHIHTQFKGSVEAHLRDMFPAKSRVER